MSSSLPAARRFHLTGIVQGVGFRPYVYTLAARHGLGGWVLNNAAGVEILVVGAPAALDAFTAELPAGVPPLAHLDRIEVEPVPLPGYPSPSLISTEVCPLFRIRHSEDQPGAFVPVAADSATCADCLAEMFDPHDRRYRYPFINCTNCGPRFTIIADVPYDRPLTTMVGFTMCPDCQAEYDNPADRRFHAQPNACPVCGPQIRFVRSPLAAPPGDERIDGEPALRRARQVLAAGGIVAVKGIGGYHLACDATNDAALAELRRRKGRVDKPFAVMARDLATAKTLAEVSAAEALVLASRERPIVLLRKRAGCALSPLVAPGNATVGVMLPYTPLHHLLLAPPDAAEPDGVDLPALVMTSGNRAEEPIVTGDDDALSHLAPLADAFLQHNRPILMHADDSVVRLVRGRLLPIRRGRGYAPLPIHLPFAVRPLLAVGAELKNTFCLTQDRYAFLSQHIGDMETLETLHAFTRSEAHFERLFRVQPELLVCDLHPGYLSTRWAQEQAQARGLPLVQVQHHHAHIAALMAEYGLPADAQVIGVSFDGTGYGADGTIWGGEVLVAGYGAFRRVARLRPVPLPGGDAAIKRPYRVALAHLWAAGVPWDETLPPVAACPSQERAILRHQLETGLNAVPTSSMGRLFDAVAALAGVRQVVTYEAQAALELEVQAAATSAPAYHFRLEPNPRIQIPQKKPGFSQPEMEQATATQSDEAVLQWEIDAGEVIRSAVADVSAGRPVGVIATRFHSGVADLILAVCRRVQAETGLATVALSGGVFQNVTLLELTLDRLEAQGFSVLVHHQLPPNDGGLALGQAVAGHFLVQSSF